MGFQLKISLLPETAGFSEDTRPQQVQNLLFRAKVLRLLQDAVHPIAEAASTVDADRVLISDAVIVKAEGDYVAGRCWVAGDMLTVLGLSGAHGIFFNPPLATQLLYRVTCAEEQPGVLFAAHQATPNFAGIVMARDTFGVRTRVTDARAPTEEEWEIRGLPLRLTEKAVTDIMEALGITKPGVRREVRGWRLVKWDKFPVPVPLALNAEQSQHRIKAGSETFVVWFHKCGY
eukprot:2113509-Amphidinium_carterae.4